MLPNPFEHPTHDHTGRAHWLADDRCGVAERVQRYVIHGIERRSHERTGRLSG
jgi:hypothetical protein